MLGTDEGAGAVTVKAPRQTPGVVGGWKRWSNFPGPSPIVDDLRFFVFARSLADRDRDSPNSRPRWRSSLRRGRPRTSARTRSSSVSAQRRLWDHLGDRLDRELRAQRGENVGVPARLSAGPRIALAVDVS